ncbi:hypothetical protein [Devosia sp.]|uniref:COG3904 family protein n=1 Tax=Devosia sp. TaxID=1871048 RepID=UPI0035B1AA4C
MTAADVRQRSALGRFVADDGALIALAFFVLLAGTAAVLYLDWRELSAAGAIEAALPDMPILPAFDPARPTPPPGPAVTTDPEALRQPLRIELGAGGVLALTGTIDPGSFTRVEAELAARGEYVKRIALDSPGGSVEDAVRIGALIEVGGYDTSVAAGALCASSCPLLLAGGKHRLASRAAAIGVHQIYAMATADALQGGLAGIGDAMAGAQKTTAVITRFLGTTGVDPAMWLHALETPPDRLYYLTPEELESYRLVTRFTD